ncbi:MAG: nucleotidyltransferase domain-containing protein [bacterium]
MSDLSIAKYRETEDAFFHYLSKNLNKSLLFYAVAGSVSRGDVIPGWSDIDVLVVIREYNKKNVLIINNALLNNSSGIKIGLTLFSSNDFTNIKMFKDPKTLYSIELIDQEICKPKIVDKKIKNNINKIKNTSSWYSKDSLAGIIHGYKHALFPISKYDEKIVYKKLATILKIILKQKGITAHSYNDVVNIARSELKGLDIKFKNPIYIMKNSDTSLRRYNDYVKFLAWLEDYPRF